MPKINLGKVVGDKGEPFTFNDFTTEQLDGITPKILKGNVTTLDPDENAIVDIRKDGINNYIDFGIPRGKNGSELKDVSSENVVMADKTTLESTMTTVNENVSANSNEINKIKSPTFNDTVSTYSTLNDANTAAETTSNAIKNKVSIFTTLSNIKKSFSAIVQGLKILGTNVGAITGITSDLAGESETVAASIKAVNALNSKLSSLFVEVSGTSTRTSIAALELKGFQITFPIPDGYQFHSVKSFYISGWSGLVLQGINTSKNNVVFNVYNTREATRECVVTAIINCIVNT